MIRTFLATVAAAILVTTMSAPSAQACLSCEYKPEVLNSGSDGPKAKKRERVDAAVKSRSKSRSAQERPSSKSRRDVADERARSKRHKHDDDNATAATETAKPVEEKAAVTEPAADTPKVNSVYNTLIRTQPGKTPEPDKVSEPEKAAEPVTAVAPAPTPPPVVTAAPVESPAPKKTIDTADVGTAQSGAQDDTGSAVVAASPPTTSASETVNVSHEKGDKATGCKKFFPMADLTLTVDCK